MGLYVWRQAAMDIEAHRLRGTDWRRAASDSTRASMACGHEARHRGLGDERREEALVGRSAPKPYVPVASAGMLSALQDALRQRPRGLLTDIDGTLSAIAPTPEQARLLPGVRGLLRASVERFDTVAAISGRAANDARRMVGVRTLTYVGNHGLEVLTPDMRRPQIAPEAQPYIAVIAECLRQARQRLEPRFTGLIFENKGVTGGVHYRLAPDPAQARLAIRETLEALTSERQVKLTEGRMVFELRPPLRLDKGTSVTRLAHERGLKSAIYLGDDRTDIDAFLALRRLREQGGRAGFAVAINHAEAPQELRETADIVLSSIEETPHFLRWLLDMAE